MTVCGRRVTQPSWVYGPFWASESILQCDCKICSNGYEKDKADEGGDPIEGRKNGCTTTGEKQWTPVSESGSSSSSLYCS